MLTARALETATGIIWPQADRIVTDGIPTGTAQPEIPS